MLVSRDQAYRIRASITIVPLTRTIRRIPSEVPLGKADGIPKASVANADDLITVPKVRVREYLTVLSAAKLADLERAIKFALDLP